jgi:hypothetical protein
MITFQDLGSISPIALTVVLIAYLMLVELGNERIRKALLPFVVILTLVFLIIAASSIYSTYVRIK